VHRFFTPLLRRLYVLVTAFVLAYGAFWFGQYTHWNKERLYRKLISGARAERAAAAFDLAWLGGQDQLLRALKSASEPVRAIAIDSLWTLWFHEAGRDAFRRAQSADRAVQQQKFSDALAILNQTTAEYPRFAEGWNRRAILFWEMGSFEQSIADCKKVVALNPNHFGAWQGMGLCQLQLGDLEAAVRSLRAALKINPYDPGLRETLRRCEELLRKLSPKQKDEWEIVCHPSLRLLERGLS
jgi:tetratricopeptide (TPR) repeat protein